MSRPNSCWKIRTIVALRRAPILSQRNGTECSTSMRTMAALNRKARELPIGRFGRVCGLATVFLVVCTGLPTARGEAAGGQHDMLLLLPDGPVHVRVHVTDAGVPLKKRREDYIDRLVAALDTDGDGALSRSETTKHPLFASARRFEGNQFLSSLRPRRPYSDEEIALALDRAAGQLVTYRQNNAFAEQDLAVFRVLDADESGIIDRVEMRLAPARIAERDSDFDQCVTFDEFLSEPSGAPEGVVLNPLNAEPPGAVHSELLRDATEPILAARMVRHYDRDRDAHLTASELGWPQARVDLLDIDGNGKLSMQELSQIASAAPDISLAINLGKPPSEAMTLVGDPPADVDVARLDLVRLQRPNLSLSVGYRHRDPIAESQQNALAAFNAIDTDANGYLDREEITEYQRFERYLFDAMDRDGDDRVFAEEMLSYVKEYAEATSTTCQVTLIDTGNGFFQMLDANADGRISIRELRDCERMLLEVAGEDAEINPSRLAKSYRIEIQRGGVSLFDRVDRPTAETPEALLKPPSGPIWFQRMDRNGDGDLTWDEFLGPREVFAQLDTDNDGLIDEVEATRASEGIDE